MTETISRADYGGYKYQWSRYVARKSLDKKVKFVKEKLAEIDPKLLNNIVPDMVPEEDSSISADTRLRDIASAADRLTFGKLPTKDGTFHMGIIGSGVSGLFTALMIDALNEKFKGTLNITYDMLEASGQKRLGGRLYTHRFTEDRAKHQYYDVGAMRFPKTEIMDRTFRLFDFLGMKSEGEKPDLVPYYLTDEKKVCPLYFNHVGKFGPPDFKTAKDPYGVNKWLPEDDPNRIPEEVINCDPGQVVDNAIAGFIEALREDLQGEVEKGEKRTDPVIDDKPGRGWELLNKADHMTTRQFFRETEEIVPGSGIKGCGYNFNTIEWLETYAYATGWYNQSLSETVLEALDFAPPNGEAEVSNKYWYCVEGGTQTVAEKMAAKIKKQPEFNRQVTAIETDLLQKGDVKLTIKSTKPDDWDKTKPFVSKSETRDYFTVFNSTTLGALQRMDLSNANLLYGTKQAIRSLNYGASCKVGIRFDEMWWMQDPWNIDRGGIAKTDLPLRVCVYPSYNVHDPKEEPGVLLCCYAWAQDAQRLGTLIDPKSPENEDELKELLLSNLAKLHAKSGHGKEYEYEALLERLHRSYMSHYAYDWYHDPNTSGAFAYFGPGQFSQMWPEIIKPNGWLFFIGEAASAHHGWIVGAIESAVRAMYQLLHLLDEQIQKRVKAGGATFSGYADAMEFLAGPRNQKDHPDWKSPFVGLPREIPVRQAGTKKDDEVSERPDEDKDLSFVAAQCISSFYEMVLELVKEQDAAGGKLVVQAE